MASESDHQPFVRETPAGRRKSSELAGRRPEDIASAVNSSMTPVRRAGGMAVARARGAAGNLSNPVTPERNIGVSDSEADEESAVEDDAVAVGRGVARRSRRSAENISRFEGGGGRGTAWSDDSQSDAELEPPRRPGACSLQGKNRRMRRISLPCWGFPRCRLPCAAVGSE
jgi:hypothetical protein